MRIVIRGADLDVGLRLRIFSVGISVTKVNAAKIFMTKLIQRN
jgi:hypothetical protein